MRKKKDKGNYLDYVPTKNSALPWSVDEEGIVTVEVSHKSLADRVAQIAFNRPKVSKIRMDKFGSFIWQQIDGTKDIYQIGQEVKKEFGKEAEPLYERMVMFFRILVQNHYIFYKKKS